MSRTLAALAALTLAAGAARAADPADLKPQAAELKPQPADLDPKTQAAIQAAVDKAVGKAEERLRTDVQAVQASTEIDAAAAPSPKLEFLELDGYFRVRGYLFDDLDLHAGTDAAGRYVYPVPLRGNNRHTLAGTNMRLRIEPTLNVSEQVRIRSQVDVFDNYALGSSNGVLFDQSGSTFPVPLYGSSRSALGTDPRQDRQAIAMKRAWAEVQTPVGLLSFGRMPAAWGLGILQNAGTGLDDDFGDTVDRIQFALPPVSTPIGPLTVVPSLDFDSEGVQRFNALGGPPRDADNSDDARTWGLKLARLDTDDEVRRKLDKGESSVNYGAYYMYKAQEWTFTDWTSGAATDASQVTTAPIKRNAYAHVLDLWTRWLRGRFRGELEVAGIAGHVGNASSDPAVPTGQILIRQLGAVARADWAVLPDKLTLGGEAGFASGDDAPGFGYRPTCPNGACSAVDGPQYGTFGGRTDQSIRNFAFNPAYRADVILFREIIGGVTDAWYVKPKLHWDVLPGLGFDGAIVYSQAVYGASTPSGTKKPLGIEADGKITYTSGDGFVAWVEYGLLQPFAALKAAVDASLSRGHAINVGLAAKF